jgi:hypothetical protein
VIAFLLSYLRHTSIAHDARFRRKFARSIYDSRRADAGTVLRRTSHNPVPDTWLWVACWATGLVLLLRSDSKVPANLAAQPVPAPLRVAHGLSALALVMIFLALHITNHLMFPAGAATYDTVMKVFRHVYRTNIVQPCWWRFSSSR